MKRVYLVLLVIAPHNSFSHCESIDTNFSGFFSKINLIDLKNQTAFHREYAILFFRKQKEMQKKSGNIQASFSLPPFKLN